MNTAPLEEMIRCVVTFVVDNFWYGIAGATLAIGVLALLVTL
jgi:hypothetical protein